jgi:CheY-like chemotaxis protein
VAVDDETGTDHARREGLPGQGRSEDTTPVGASRGLVLVVEDSEDVLLVLTEALGDAGYRISGVQTPEDALDAIRAEEPDAILLDIMLPHRSGIEVADSFWLNGFAHVPIIGMSASVVMRDLVRQSKLFRAVLDKPFDLSDFLSLMEDILADRPSDWSSGGASSHP